MSEEAQKAEAVQNAAKSEAKPEEAATPGAKRSGLASAKVRLLLLAVLVVLVGGGVPFYLYAAAHESTDDAFIEGHVVPMSPRVSGHVAQVLVRDNQYVHTGDLLVEIDPRDYRTALDAAEASAMAAQAAVEEAVAQTSTSESNLHSAQAALSSEEASLGELRADVSQSRAEYVRDSKDLGRTQSMAHSGAISPQQLDHAVADSQMAKAKLNASQRKVATQRARIRQAQAAIAAAENTKRQSQALIDARKADLRRAQAQVEQARLNLSYTRITAPCDGYVTRRSVEAGAYVQVGQGLFSLVRPDVWVVANFKETQLTDMRVGQPVEVEVDTYPGVTFRAHVDSIQRGTGSRFSLLPPENATGNFVKVVQRVPVKIVFDRDETTADYLLTPGMSTVPVVKISEGGAALASASAPVNRSVPVSMERASSDVPYGNVQQSEVQPGNLPSGTLVMDQGEIAEKSVDGNLEPNLDKAVNNAVALAPAKVVEQ